jgi:hypothetical protein
VAKVMVTEHDLPTLRVRLTGEGRQRLTAAFEAVRGRGPVRPITEVVTRTIGLPDRIRSAGDIADSRFVLPSGLTDAIVQALQDLAVTDVPAYWLDLPSPRGYLQLVPWERLLSPALGRPLLRLPSSALRPNAPGPTVRVVLVAGQAVGVPTFDTAPLVADLVDAWTGSTEREVLLDVFVDTESYPSVQARLRGRPAVAVHDPFTAVETRRIAAARQGEDDEAWAYPWTEWVAAALGGRAADVIHILGQGHISGDRGAIALPASPSATGADRSGRFLGPTQMCKALTRLGAWSLLLSGVPGNHCQPGLRDLADAIAQARTGVVVLHQMEDTGPVAELKPALGMVFGDEPPNRPLPGITCWSHPQFVGYPPDDVALCGVDGTSSLITGATQQALAQHDTPAWVAAGTRALENLQAEWTPTDGSPPDPYAVDALHAISKLFDEHVQTYGLPDGGGTR